MALKFVSLTAERRGKRSVKEWILELRHARETVEDGDGGEITVCNLETAAQFMGKPISEVKAKVKGLIEKFGQDKLNAAVGVEGFVAEERKRGRKSGKRARNDLAMLEALAMDFEETEELEDAAA
jgi:hypothetical protein